MTPNFNSFFVLFIMMVTFIGLSVRKITTFEHLSYIVFSNAEDVVLNGKFRFNLDFKYNMKYNPTK